MAGPERGYAASEAIPEAPEPDIDVALRQWRSLCDQHDEQCARLIEALRLACGHLEERNLALGSLRKEIETHHPGRLVSDQALAQRPKERGW